MARTDEILAASGDYEIAWNEAFGGRLYKANATLSPIEDGITDIGRVFSCLEAAQLAMSQVLTNTPFATATLPGVARGHGRAVGNQRCLVRRTGRS